MTTDGPSLDAMAQHEGAILKKLLKERGKTVRDLAVACGVEWTAAKKYVAASTIGPGAWETCRKGMEKLGIDPDLVKPPRPPGTMLTAMATEDLKPLVADFNRGQMERLRKILQSDDASRSRLIDYIDGFLAASK
jgi:hypothetical protein